MILTKELIEAGRSETGCFNGAQMKVLGVAPKPDKGWVFRLCGKQISEADYATFLQLKGVTRQKIGHVRRRPREHAELFSTESAEDFANALFEQSGGNLE